MSKEAITTNQEDNKETYTTTYTICGEEFQITRPVAKTLEEIERRTAVEFALANTSLEGYETTDDLREMMERYIVGEITIDDMLQETKRKFAHILPKE